MLIITGLVIWFVYFRDNNSKKNNSVEDVIEITSESKTLEIDYSEEEIRYKNDWKELSVTIPNSLKDNMDAAQIEALVQVLGQDPRPRYQDDPERIYGLDFDGFNVKFRVMDGHAIVLSAEKY